VVKKGQASDLWIKEGGKRQKHLFPRNAPNQRSWGGGGQESKKRGGLEYKKKGAQGNNVTSRKITQGERKTRESSSQKGTNQGKEEPYRWGGESQGDSDMKFRQRKEKEKHCKIGKRKD